MAQKRRSSQRRPQRRHNGPAYVAPVLDPTWKSPYGASGEEREGRENAIRRSATRQLIVGAVVGVVAAVAVALAGYYVISFVVIVVAALFGLFQGGIVPSYTLIVRDYFAPAEVGARVGTVLMATLFGMAIGGWMSGAIFDLTGSYRAAFVNGIAWNLLNLSIVLVLLYRARRYATA